MELRKELLAKAKEAKSVEELLAFAKENGIELTDEKAKEYFTKLNTKSEELSDEELDNVSGGCGNSDHFGGIIIDETRYCPYCGAENTEERLSTGDIYIDCYNCGKRTIF